LQDFSGARVNRPLTITELSADALAAEVGRQDAAAAEALTARAAGLLLTGLPPQHAHPFGRPFTIDADAPLTGPEGLPRDDDTRRPQLHYSNDAGAHIYFQHKTVGGRWLLASAFTPVSDNPSYRASVITRDLNRLAPGAAQREHMDPLPTGERTWRYGEVTRLWADRALTVVELDAAELLGEVARQDAAVAAAKAAAAAQAQRAAGLLVTGLREETGCRPFTVSDDTIESGAVVYSNRTPAERMDASGGMHLFFRPELGLWMLNELLVSPEGLVQNTAVRSFIVAAGAVPVGACVWQRCPLVSAQRFADTQLTVQELTAEELAAEMARQDAVDTARAAAAAAPLRGSSEEEDGDDNEAPAVDSSSLNATLHTTAAFKPGSRTVTDLMAAQLGESSAFGGGGGGGDWHFRGAGGGVAGGLSPMEPDQCTASTELVVAREAAEARQLAEARLRRRSGRNLLKAAGELAKPDLSNTFAAGTTKEADPAEGGRHRRVRKFRGARQRNRGGAAGAAPVAAPVAAVAPADATIFGAAAAAPAADEQDRLVQAAEDMLAEERSQLQQDSVHVAEPAAEGDSSGEEL
jgi:hypothetical protein